jgi:hypothetical protein
MIHESDFTRRPETIKAQLETYNYYIVDLISSISLREPLLTIPPEAAQGSIMEAGPIGDDCEDINQVIVWSHSVSLRRRRGILPGHIRALGMDARSGLDAAEQLLAEAAQNFSASGGSKSNSDSILIFRR